MQPHEQWLSTLPAFHYTTNRFQSFVLCSTFPQAHQSATGLPQGCPLSPFTNPHNGAGNWRRTAFSSTLSLLLMFSTKQVYSSKRTEGRWAKERQVKAVLSFLIFLWKLVGGGDKSITVLTLILFGEPPHLPQKTKLLSKLIACHSKTGIKENNQPAWINLWQPPYLSLAPLLFSDELLLFPATACHTSLPPFIASLCCGGGPFPLLKNLYLSRTKRRRSQTIRSANLLRQQPLTCY